MAVPQSIVRDAAQRMGHLTDIQRGTYEWRDLDDRLHWGESLSYRVDGVAQCDVYHRQNDPMMFERYFFLLDVQAEQQMAASVAEAAVVLASRTPDDEWLPDEEIPF